MPTRYVNPKNDLIFKRIFGDHPELLKSFLNALLPLPDDALIDSLQLLWSNSFQQRVLFEASHAYVKQLKIGVNYDSLKPVYALALTNTIFVRDSERYRHHYQFVCREDTKQIIKGMEFVFVEIPKFKPTTTLDKRITVLWMRFMSEVGTETEQTIDPELANHPLIGQALKITEQAGLSEAELEAYRRFEDRARVDVLYSTDARNEGREQGRAEGRAEGRQQGRAEGEAQAKAEALQRLLTRKFGNLPTEITTKIVAASIPQIDQWFDIAIACTSLDAVFTGH
jgi:predicted transposase/invertase (TIGR01784 family)